MDVENQVKINELAKDLQNKGLAPSSVDAMRMAQSIIGKEDTKPEQSSEVIEDPKPSTEPSPVDKAEILVERSERRIMHEFADLREQLKVLSGQLAMVTNEVNKIIKSQRQAPQTVLKQESSTAGSKQSEPKKSDTYSVGDKTFSKEDVAVDKVFYFGQK